jgi:hypothetical protein
LTSVIVDSVRAILFSGLVALFSLPSLVTKTLPKKILIFNAITILIATVQATYEQEKETSQYF